MALWVPKMIMMIGCVGGECVCRGGGRGGKEVHAFRGFMWLGLSPWPHTHTHTHTLPPHTPNHHYHLNPEGVCGMSYGQAGYKKKDGSTNNFPATMLVRTIMA